MSGTLIREATIEDVPGILECLSELTEVSEFTSSVHSAFYERLMCGNIFTFVYATKYKVIGTASLHFFRRLARNGAISACIEDVAVGKRYQGYGIGRKLIRFCSDYAAGLGAYKVTLNCVPALFHFYKDYGFYQSGIEMREDHLVKIPSTKILPTKEH